VSPKQIVAIRKTLKLTQAKLAEQIGAQRPTVARWETGRNLPKGAYLKALEALAAKSKAKIRTMRKQPVALGHRISAKKLFCIFAAIDRLQCKPQACR
jgi:transcriptional regulator with XRE-family HTH domain